MGTSFIFSSLFMGDFDNKYLFNFLLFLVSTKLFKFK